MANDLEDFLKRAAARRQAAQAQKRQANTANAPGRPTASHSPVRDERRIRETVEEAEPILEAELVDSEFTQPRVIRDKPEVITREQKSAIKRARDAADRANRYKAASSIKTERTKAARPAIETVASSTGSEEIDALLAALSSRQGFRQAMMLREILDRPTHRW